MAKEEQHKVVHLRAFYGPIHTYLLLTFLWVELCPLTIRKFKRGWETQWSCVPGKRITRIFKQLRLSFLLDCEELTSACSSCPAFSLQKQGSCGLDKLLLLASCGEFRARIRARVTLVLGHYSHPNTATLAKVFQNHSSTKTPVWLQSLQQHQPVSCSRCLSTVPQDTGGKAVLFTARLVLSPLHKATPTECHSRLTIPIISSLHQ